MTDRQRAEKQASNETYADKYPRRSKKLRRKARKARAERSELYWLAQSGIERDTRWPLI
jgi:hypothetical protein